MKLQTKLLILYALSTIFIILAMGVFFYDRLWEERLESIREDMRNQLQHVDFAVNSFFNDVESDINTLAAIDIVRTKDDRDFTNFLNADEKTFQYHIHNREQQIIDIFNNYRVTHPYVNSVYMGRENGASVRSHKRERPTRYDPRERPWYVLAKNNPEKVMMTEAYPSLTTSDVNIGVVKALVDEKSNMYGVVGADVTLVNLTDYISNFKTNPSGKLILMDKNGVVLAGLGKDALFKDVKYYSPDVSRIVSEAVHGVVSVHIQNVEYYIFYRTASVQDWKIAALVPSVNIEKQIIG